MTQVLRQSTAVDVLIGSFVDKTDGATAETGESPTVKLSKNGQTKVAKNDATTPVHDSDGDYNCELDATDTNTVGTLVLTVAASANALPIRHEYQVLDENAYDALYGSTATILTARDIGLLYEGTITTVNSQTSFDCSAEGIANDDIFNGLICSIEDISTGDTHVGWISDTDQANNRLIVNIAPSFTVVTGDKIRVHVIQHSMYALNNAPTLDVNVIEVIGKTLAVSGTGSFDIGEA